MYFLMQNPKTVFTVIILRQIIFLRGFEKNLNKKKEIMLK